jgi:hypothetical protein
MVFQLQHDPCILCITMSFFYGDSDSDPRDDDGKPQVLFMMKAGQDNGRPPPYAPDVPSAPPFEDVGGGQMFQQQQDMLRLFQIASSSPQSLYPPVSPSLYPDMPPSVFPGGDGGVDDGGYEPSDIQDSPNQPPYAAEHRMWGDAGPLRSVVGSESDVRVSSIKNGCLNEMRVKCQKMKDRQADFRACKVKKETYAGRLDVHRADGNEQKQQKYMAKMQNLKQMMQGILDEITQIESEIYQNQDSPERGDRVRMRQLYMV